MRALYYDNRTKTVFFRGDVPIPEPEDGESLIHIRVAAVCSTDKEIIKGYKPDFCGVLGHEFVGTVEKSGDDALIGRRVVGEINAGCGECVYCKTGREKHCLTRKCIGIAGKDGCFADYMTIRTSCLHLVPDGMPDEVAVNTEPLAAAFCVTELAHIKPSQPVAVVGDGRLAFLCAQVLALTGAEVVVCGLLPEKLAHFHPFARIEREPDETFETVVECSGNPSGFDTARKIVRRGGRIILKSTHAGDPVNNLSDLVVNEISVIGSRCGPFPPALRLMERGLIALPEIKLFRPEQWEEALGCRDFKSGFDYRL
ncbi:MAG TPA: alcohol dehydrogenase catalytic domain-containing protein [Oscillospiraceae bacterium]|nr:alcohol dehydrogenase catalytic domain-containing protein [Oscillospiraceae bacterium]HNW05102.1 alcohol dehydrogenase catalytic domain-containing protein [Oscillospiraceae bacterium]